MEQETAYNIKVMVTQSSKKIRGSQDRVGSSPTTSTNPRSTIRQLLNVLSGKGKANAYTPGDVRSNEPHRGY